MMNQTTARPRTAGEAAADGLLHGVGAGFGMFVYLLIVWVVNGRSPVDLLLQFTPPGTRGDVALLGLILHLGVSAIYGVLFGLIWRPFSRRMPGNARLAGGVIYAMALFLFAVFVLLPASQSSFLQIPLHFAIAHVIYGLMLGNLTRHI